MSGSNSFTKLAIHQLTNCAFMPVGEVAQLVEHTTENRSVDSSILSLATTNDLPLTDLARLDFSASASVFAIVPASACSLRDASARSSSLVMS
jgi:hypothetical protein